MLTCSQLQNKFAGKQSVEAATCIAILRFNYGSMAALRIINDTMGIDTHSSEYRLASSQDKSRLTQSLNLQSSSSHKSRLARVARSHGSTDYSAGEF